MDQRCGGHDDAGEGADLLLECERALEVLHRGIRESQDSLQEPQEPPHRPVHRVGPTEDHQPSLVGRQDGPKDCGGVETSGRVSDNGQIGDRAEPPRAGAGQLDSPVDDPVQLELGLSGPPEIDKDPRGGRFVEMAR